MLTSTDISTMLDGVASVPTTVITAALADAGAHVIFDGVPDTDDMYDLLHKYYTMYLLQLWGHVEDVVSEEVGDVKSTYEKAGYAEGETKWLAAYNRLLTKVLAV